MKFNFFFETKRFHAAIFFFTLLWQGLCIFPLIDWKQIHRVYIIELIYLSKVFFKNKLSNPKLYIRLNSLNSAIPSCIFIYLFNVFLC